MLKTQRVDKRLLNHVIKDPVHGTMQFTATEDPWLKPFIDSAPFQRLRHIKQLGMGDYIFPGAVHTRFNHCLGCCYLASEIAHHIGLADEERQLVMIACLLHDLGHGPFSHTFEDIFTHKRIRHEAWTPFFLAEYRHADFLDAYNRRNPRYPLTEEKFQLIENMIMHRSSVRRVLADIVSSQMDADRLDYLLRDSHFCGVTYGEFDCRWMLNSMLIVNTQQGERLGLIDKGIGVVEHYLMARRLMMRNIYHYPKKLAIEYFLSQLLIQLAQSLDAFAPFTAIKESRLSLFLRAVNRFNHSIRDSTQPEKDEHHFLEKNYVLYKALCDYDIFQTIEWLASQTLSHPAIEIAKRLSKRIMPKIIRLEHTHRDIVDNALADLRLKHPSIQPWQCAFIETPHHSYHAKEDPIYIENARGVVRPLTDISLMIDAISDKCEHTAFLCIDRFIFEEPHVQYFIRSINQSHAEAIT